MSSLLTLTCWYLNVKYAAGGRKPITAQARTRMLVLIGQLSAATHGEASLQASHPSAHGRHSYEFILLYVEASLCKIWKSKLYEY